VTQINPRGYPVRTDMSETKPCDGHFPGWRCTRNANHPGPCALKARWWNIRGWMRV
jgi:hypothetical protein